MPPFYASHINHSPTSSVVPHPVSSGCCSWECTLNHALAWDWVESWLCKPTAKARFMAAVMAKSVAYEQQREPPGRATAVAGWMH